MTLYWEVGTGELRAIINSVLHSRDCPPVEVQFKDVECGRARYGTRKITMPYWALCEGWGFAIYYALHEAAHFIVKNECLMLPPCHGKTFRRIEDELLAERGMSILRKKVFPQALYASGECVYSHKWKNQKYP